MAISSMEAACRGRRKLGTRWPVILWLLCVVASLGTCIDTSYVQGVSWRGPPRSVTLQALGKGGDAEAKRLTVRMKEATSAQELIDILRGVVDGPIFNNFHAGSAYHRLATWKKWGKLDQSAKEDLASLRLESRDQEMMMEGRLDARQVANVFWSLAYLFDEFPTVLDMMPSVKEQILVMSKDMNAYDLSNILWALANLKYGSPDVLDIVPAIVAQIPAKAKDMIPQQLSNILWASANLKDDAADVLDIVPAIVAQIPAKAKDMIPQDLSNILWASANLKDDAPDVLDALPAIVAQIPAKAKQLKPQELSNILWASANLKDDAPDVLETVPAIVAQIPLKAKDMKPQELSNIIWASAKLKEDAPDVLDIVSAIVAQIPLKVKDMIPQHLSNILSASAKLKDDAPDVLDIVPAIVARIPAMAKYMNTQHLSNSLVALLHFQESVPAVRSFLGDEGGAGVAFPRHAASHVVSKISKLSGLDLFLAVPAVVWACAKVELIHDELLSAVAKHLGPRKKVSRLSAWALCALYGSYDLLGQTERFDDFSEMLRTELRRRRLSESDVSRSLEGPLDWAAANK